MTDNVREALVELLRPGPLRSTAMWTELLERRGFSRNSIDRARKALGVQRRQVRVGERNVWFVTLPTHCPTCARPYETGWPLDGEAWPRPASPWVEEETRKLPPDPEPGEDSPAPEPWALSMGSECSVCRRQTTLPAGSRCIFIGHHGEPCTGVTR